MQEYYKKIIEQMGEDTSREGLVNTPERAANAMMYLTKGYRESLDEIVNDALFDTDMSELVIVKDIEIYSLCEHHLLPFIGRCHVGYLPNGKVLGLSKVARIVDYFARRLQMQEQLTQQIADCIAEVTKAAGVAVVVEARHLCMMMRGIEKQNSSMKTSVMLGCLREQPATRMEFLSLIQ